MWWLTHHSFHPNCFPLCKWLLCSFFRIRGVIPDMKKLKRTSPPITMTSWTNGHSSVTALINIRVACCNKQHSCTCNHMRNLQRVPAITPWCIPVYFNYQFTLFLMSVIPVLWIINEEQAKRQMVEVYVTSYLMNVAKSTIHAWSCGSLHPCPPQILSWLHNYIAL